MNSNDQKDPVESPLDKAEPYRTPTAVSEPTSGGFLTSPVVWLGAIGLLVVFAGMFLMAPVSTGRSGVEYIEDFGVTRAGPPREIEDLEDVTAQPAPQMNE